MTERVGAHRELAPIRALMGGEIRAGSKAGEGSTFTFSCRFAPGPATAAPPPVPRREQALHRYAYVQAVTIVASLLTAVAEGEAGPGLEMRP